MIVVDASVLAPALLDDASDGERARARLAYEALAAPEIIDLEVASVVRRQLHADQVSLERAQVALDDLRALPIERAGHRSLIGRCWELRNNLSVYDAAYVAVAELLGVVLVTADVRLARAPGATCTVETLTRSD